jgi:hypothetical protein
MIARRTVALLFLALAATTPAALSHDGHVHETHDVAAEGAPAITGFRIEKDAVGGWNVFVETENFTFAPELVNTDNVDNTGHAHLYINGTKLARLYGPAHHIEALPFGPHDFRVVLNTNQHEEYAIAGRPIAAELTLTVE